MASGEVISLCTVKLIREEGEIKDWLAKNPNPPLMVEGYERGAGFNLQQLNQHNHQTSKERLEDIAEAQKRIKNKTFGACVDCGQEIPDERLMLLPYATRCAVCQSKKGLKVH